MSSMIFIFPCVREVFVVEQIPGQVHSSSLGKGWRCAASCQGKGQAA